MRYLLALIITLTGVSAQAQSIEGRWLSQEWGGVRSVVEVSACDEGYCGVIVGARDISGAQEVPAPEGALGHRIFWGFDDFGTASKPRGKLKPPGGAPQLNATITDINAGSVTIRACLLLICQNEVMVRL